MQTKFDNEEPVDELTPDKQIPKIRTNTVSRVHKVVSKTTTGTSGLRTLETASINHPRDPDDPNKPLVIKPALPENIGQELEVKTEVITEDPIEVMKKMDKTCCICKKDNGLAVKTDEGIICAQCVGVAAIRILREEK